MLHLVFVRLAAWNGDLKGTEMKPFIARFATCPVGEHSDVMSGIAFWHQFQEALIIVGSMEVAMDGLRTSILSTASDMTESGGNPSRDEPTNK